MITLDAARWYNCDSHTNNTFASSGEVWSNDSVGVIDGCLPYVVVEYVVNFNFSTKPK
jgi:hypothetical protein